MYKNSNSEYTRRINKVMDYIENNLDTELKLEDLAGVANFSKYHFHRIFHNFIGEPLATFIRRIRLEKAASALLYKPNITIADIAYTCGFSGPDTFARCFKAYFGESATEYRERRLNLTESKICKEESKNGKTVSKGRQFNGDVVYYLGDNKYKSSRRNEMFNEKNVPVEVKYVETFHVAYLRHIGPYKGDEQLFSNLWRKYMSWAGPRGIMEKPGAKCLSIYHDDPEITDENKLRLSIGVTVDSDTEVDGDIGKMEIPASNYIVASFIIDVEGYEPAWAYVYGDLLPKSGYEPTDGYPFEHIKNNPEEHPEHKHIIDIYVPVKPI